jgi:hypothetical protein
MMRTIFADNCGGMGTAGGKAICPSAFATRRFSQGPLIVIPMLKRKVAYQQVVSGSELFLHEFSHARRRCQIGECRGTCAARPVKRNNSPIVFKPMVENRLDLNVRDVLEARATADLNQRSFLEVLFVQKRLGHWGSPAEVHLVQYQLSPNPSAGYPTEEADAVIAAERNAGSPGQGDSAHG